jgi:methionyl-tRNA synthetase
VLTQKFFDNKVPARTDWEAEDNLILSAIENSKNAIGDSIELYRFREATSALINLARIGNKYLAETEPWKLAKTDIKRVGTILNLALQIAANLSIVVEPFLPFTAIKLRRMLSLDKLNWNIAGSANLLSEGHQLGEPELLFDKIEDGTIEAQINKLINKKKAIEMANIPIEPSKPTVAFDDFSKMDIRIGKVVEVEVVAKSKKLLKLTVDTGIDKRTVMSGIAEYFSPAQIINQQVTILVNLAPRKIMGVESQGMVLMVADKGGNLRLLRPEEEVSNGSIIS